jgi:hypothetical protein
MPGGLERTDTHKAKSNPDLSEKRVGDMPTEPNAQPGNPSKKQGIPSEAKPAKKQKPPPKGGGKRKPSENFLKASARWRAHLADYRVKNPGQSLKKQMKGAKKTYRRSSQVKDTGVKDTSVRPKTRRKRKTKRRVTRKKKRSFFGF